MSRNRLFSLIFVGLFIALAVIFTSLYRSQVENLIVNPINHWLWQLRTTARSLNPELVWGLFVFFLFLLALVLFPTSQRQSQNKIQTNLQIADSRLEFWLAELVRLKNKQFLSKSKLIALKRLTLEVIAYHEHLSTRQEAEKWVRENSQNFPDEINQLITQEPFNYVRPQNFFLISMVNSLFHLHLLEKQVPIFFEAQKINAIIHFLENQIEVVNVYEN